MCALKSPMSKVLSNTSLSGFLGTKTFGTGGWGLCSPNFLPPLPLLRRICFWQINVERRLFYIYIYIYIYILNFAGNSDLFCCKDVACVVFIYSCTIYILPLLPSTCLTYVFCCGTLLIYIGNHKIQSNFGYITTGKFFKDYFVVFDIYLRVLIYPKLLEENQVITC